MRILQGAAALAAALLVLLLAVVGVSSIGWRRATASMVRDLERGAREPRPPTHPELEALPAPVLRYLSRAIPPDGRRILRAVIEQEGTFQMGEGEAGWRPFTATQHVRAVPPAFVWDARIRMAPLVPVAVRDGYLDGRPTMRGAVWSTVVMVEGETTRALAEGSLYRYLAEAAWMPTRLLPGEGLTWRAVDDTTAEATLRDGDVQVSVQFRFDAAGDLVGMWVPARPRVDAGVSRDLPWVGRFREHRDVDGYRIPGAGEVAWVVDGVEVPYWRGRLTSVRFRTAP